MLAAKNIESSKTKAEKPSAQVNAKSETKERSQVNPLWSRLATRVQAKLTVGAPDDPYEREADAMADRVMRMPDMPLVQRKCADCEEEDKQLQRKPLASQITPFIQTNIQCYAGQASEGKNTAPASVDRALASSGRPLGTALQQDMGQRFGHDFSRVRVHSGATAERSARDVNAHAYTVGHNIVFGEGRFAPGTRAGRRLIAHELTHVVQQSGVGVVRAGQNTANRGFSGQKRIMESDPIHQVALTVQRDTQRDELLTAYNEALSRSDWNEVAVRLNGFNDADIKSLVSKYSKETLIAVKDAALTVMPGWNARVVRPVNARLATLMGSDQVLHASAKEIQDYLLHSPFLKAYVSSKFSGGNPLEGHIHIDDDAAFRTACIAYTMRQGKTREEAEVLEPQQSAFREGDDIHVRKDDGKFTTTIHESMHRFSSPEYQRRLSQNANEGAADYFTRFISKDQELPFKASYPKQLNSTDLLVGASDKEKVADAYFNGELSALLTAVDTAKGAGTLRRWSEFINKGAYTQADVLLK